MTEVKPVPKPALPEVKSQPMAEVKPAPKPASPPEMKSQPMTEVKPVPKPAPPEVNATAKPLAARVPGDTAAGAFRRGFSLLQDDHLEEAIAQLDVALKLDPTMSVAYNARGYAHYRLKQYLRAVEDYDLAILLNPTYTKAYLNRSFAKRANGDIAGADADAARAKKLTGMPGK
jgi:tetratricopeptide (TPR) repeat protein